MNHQRPPLARLTQLIGSIVLWEYVIKAIMKLFLSSYIETTIRPCAPGSERPSQTDYRGVGGNPVFRTL